MLQEHVENSPKRLGERARKRKSYPRRRPAALVGTILMHTILITGAITMLAPFAWMVISSLKRSDQAFAIPPSFIPNPFVWQNYPQALQSLPFGQGFFNSFYITLIVVVSQLFTCSLAGYAFARLRFPLRSLWFILILATIMVPQQITIIPLFLIMRQLGWVNTHLSIIVPFALFNAFGVFLMRQAVLGIPKELEEAAIIDGASPWIIYSRIVLPLLGAPLSALGILSFLANWNNFFVPLIMLNDQNLFTVPMMLNQFVGQFSTSWTLLMAASTVAVIPVLIIYIIGQKYIIQGFATTGLKG
jgi:multiple sugar transport system permease protein